VYSRRSYEATQTADELLISEACEVPERTAEHVHRRFVEPCLEADLFLTKQDS
jgi:hypothetical protein